MNRQTTDDATAADKARLWDMIRGMRFGMLVSRGDDGALRSCPLTTQNRSVDEDATLWFFIERGGELAQDLAREPEVNLAYADLDDDRYVSVSGRAELLDDPARVQALWSPAAKAWFPGGAADPGLQLLAVRIERAEYWDVKSSKMVQLWKMAKAALTGRPPSRLGTHREVDVR